MITLLLLILNVIQLPITIGMIVYALSLFDILVTQGPRKGQVMVVMRSEDPFLYIGNIDGHWVHPMTGNAYSLTDPDNPKPSNLILPETIRIFGWDTGLYYMGWPPYIHRYRYKFSWNQWAKKKQDNGTTTEEYDVIARAEVVDSVFHIAQYAVPAIGAETKEGVPMDETVVLTLQITHFGFALFRNSSPGWLSAVDAAALGVIGDFNRKKEVDELFELQTEIPDHGGKTEFQSCFDELNSSHAGNPSLEATYGVRIIAVNLVHLAIGKPQNDTQKAAIQEYLAKQDRKVKDIEAQTRMENSEKDKVTTQNNADAEAYRIERTGAATATAEALAIEKKGTAEAEAAKKLIAAIKGNELCYPETAIAAALHGTKAQTVVFGDKLTPVKPV